MRPPIRTNDRDKTKGPRSGPNWYRWLIASTSVIGAGYALYMFWKPAAPPPEVIVSSQIQVNVASDSKDDKDNQKADKLLTEIAKTSQSRDKCISQCRAQSAKSLEKIIRNLEASVPELTKTQAAGGQDGKAKLSSKSNDNNNALPNVNESLKADIKPAADRRQQYKTNIAENPCGSTASSPGENCQQKNPTKKSLYSLLKHLFSDD